MRHTTIALMLQSPILRAGLMTLLRNINDVPCSVVEIAESDYIEELARLRPSVLIADPAVSDADWAMLKSSSSMPLKLVAILTTQMPKSRLKWFDDSFSIYDSSDVVADLLKRHIAPDDDDYKSKDLSPREKEVVIGIVKGLSNKEIAAEMNVSVNTVMTHRRNIAAKLHIHTPAGLTIYAIVSNLVKLEDIKSDMSRL